MALAPRRSADRPDKPWQPGRFQVSGPYRRTRDVWTTNARTGERVRKPRTTFDVRYRVDGHAFRYGHEQKGWADDFAYRLKAGFAAGWLFDPQSRQFLDPDAARVEEPKLTFFEHAREYLHRKWPGWEPATRRNAQRDLARACLELLHEDAPALSPRERRISDEFLRRVALMWPPADDTTEDDQRWESWFLRWSLPLIDVTDQHLQDFMTAVRSTALDGSPRVLSSASATRTRAVVKGAFTSALKRRLIEWDPWLGVEAEPRRDGDQVDPDLVMSPTEVRHVAALCGEVDQRYDAFVRIQGFCRLRPGEAIAVRR
ncbi:MAG: hypothetical protein GEU81_17210, partial [Nitriliruptorales bacterium]|nr:hypothetical protein [Nitriliruptorales bacterium]